jgi:uncharacterized protein YgiM (DUF1202 family)
MLRSGKAFYSLIGASLLLFSHPASAGGVKVKYSAGESVIVRSMPDQKSQPVEKLAKGEAVYFLGETSGNKSRITINKKEYNEPWQKIRTARSGSQKEGWVFAPLLADAPLATKRFAVIAFTDTNDVSEDWNWFFHDITVAFKGSNVHVVHSTNEPLAPIGPSSAPFDIVDIGDYIKKHGSGYLCYKNGEVVFLEYDTSDVTIRKAKEFFGMR